MDVFRIDFGCTDGAEQLQMIRVATENRSSSYRPLPVPEWSAAGGSGVLRSGGLQMLGPVATMPFPGPAGDHHHTARLRPDVLELDGTGNLPRSQAEYSRRLQLRRDSPGRNQAARVAGVRGRTLEHQ